MQIGLCRSRVLAVGISAAIASHTIAMSQQSQRNSAEQIVLEMVGNEQKAFHDHVHYRYMSEERSERTKRHLWSERMVETEWGTIRYLVALDGKSLSADQIADEKARLAEVVLDPEGYQRKESKEDDAEQCRHMLDIMPKAFVFETLSEDAHEIRISYRPNPAFTAQTMEERALHGMEGSLSLDSKTLRLRRLEGRAPKDVSLGLGPFAKLKAGSNFVLERQQVQSTVWRTEDLNSSILGKALLLGTIGRQQEYQRSDFVLVPAQLSLGQMITLLEQ